MGIVDTPTQHQLFRSDGLLGRRRKSSLLDPMGYPIEIYWRISFAIDAANQKARQLLSTNRVVKTRRGSTHELVKPFFGKSFEMVVCPPSKPALGFPFPDRAFWPLCPRPEVLPKPELRPRPRRFCFGLVNIVILSLENSAYCVPRAH